MGGMLVRRKDLTNPATGIGWAEIRKAKREELGEKPGM